MIMMKKMFSCTWFIARIISIIIVIILLSSTPSTASLSSILSIPDEVYEEQQQQQQKQSRIQHPYDPHFEINRNVIVHLFEWKFNDVANECENFLGPKGFGGVQLSPVNEYLIVKNKNVNHSWWESYQPISYIIKSRSGNEEQFLKMSKICNNAGIRLYVDVVFNHMAASLANSRNVIGTAGSKVNPNKFDYPSVPYTREHFHRSCTIQNYNDAYEVRNCMLGTLPDLDHSKEHVRMKIIEFLNHLVDLGVAGFRVDAAKHIWPIDLENIYNEVKNLSTEFGFPENTRPFFYQEVIDLGGEAISKIEYLGYGAVTEFLYSLEIGKIFNGNASLAELKKIGTTIGYTPSEAAIVFVDNHDNQRGHGAGGDLILTHKQPKQYLMAIAFMLSYPYGIPRLMSSYEFENSDQGPPSKTDDDNTDNMNEIISPEFDKNDGQCKQDWVCEHRWPPIVNLIEFHNLINDHNSDDGINPITNWYENNPNQISFCRGKKGFIAFNNDPENDFVDDVYIKECLESGIYCDIISSDGVNWGQQMNMNECIGKRVEVNKNGMVGINIPSDDKFGVIVIHEKSKLK